MSNWHQPGGADAAIGIHPARVDSLPCPDPADKAALRREFLRRRRELDDAMRREAENRIVANLGGWEIFRRAGRVVLYCSDGLEPDLSALYDARSYFPRWNGVHYEMARPGNGDAPWRTGQHGLREPTGELLADPGADDILWLIPGVAFDGGGGRLGRGGGWYDRLLTKARGVSVGVFFSVQQAEKVPMAPHDRRLQWIATEKFIRHIDDV